MNLEIEGKIVAILRKRSNIKFAYLFGSMIKGKMRYGSDIDIALYFDSEPGINELGDLINKLEAEIKNIVDIVGLNGLEKTNPTLAQTVVSLGKLIYVSDESILKKFKAAVFLHYLDFKYINDMFLTSFNSRLSKNKFAVFDK